MFRTLIYILIDPITWLLLGLGGLWYVYQKHKRRKFKIYAAIYAVAFYMMTTPFLSEYLIENWERQYPVLQVNELDTALDYHLLILGAGAYYDTTLPNTSKLSHNVMARLVEGIRLYQLLPHAKLVTSANSPSDRTPQAITVMRAAVELGVPEVDIFPQVEPWNTQTEAQVFVERFGKKQPLIVVTSAHHMPRVMTWMTHYGAEQVWAAPCDYKIKNAHDDPFEWKTLFPSIRRTTQLKLHVKERLGVLPLWYLRR